MFHAQSFRHAPYILFRYLESDWRNPIDRERDATRAKEVLQQLTSGTAPEHSSDELTSESYGHRILFSFTKNGMVEDVSTALRYMRTKTNLEAFHFNALLRCVVSKGENHAATNLLQLMEHKGEADEETAAIVVSALHTWSGKNRMQSIISLLRQVYLPRKQQQQNDEDNSSDSTKMASSGSSCAAVLSEPLPMSTPWTVRTAWELSLWPRPKRNGAELPVALVRQPRDLPEFSRTQIDDALLPPNGAWAPSRRHDLKRASQKESQLLSAVLNAVVNGPEGAMAALVVVVWMKAGGAELGSYDFFHLLTALARDLEQLREIRSIFASSSSPALAAAGCPSGYITLSYVKDSIGRLVSSYAGGQPPYWLRAATALAKLAVEVAEEHRPGLSTTPVHVGFVNSTKAADSVDGMISLIFEEMHRRNTVGAAGESPEHVHHAYTLALLSLRRDSMAVREIGNFWTHLQKRKQREAKKLLPGDDEVSRRERGAETEKSAAAASSSSAPQQQQKKKRRTKSLFHHDKNASPQDDAAASQQPQKQQPKTITKALLALNEETAPPLFPGNGAAVPRIHLWFVRDAAQRFSHAPRAILSSVKPAYQDLCRLGAQNSEEVDQWMCWALGIPLLSTHEEIRAATETVIQTLRRRDAERSVRQMVRSLLQLFASRPPPRPHGDAAVKAAQARREHFVAERKKWAGYFEARDAALAFFGHTRTARDMMKRVFAEDKLPSVRSPDVVEGDVADVAAAFGVSDAEIGGLFRKRLSSAPVMGCLPHVPLHHDTSTPEGKSNKFPALMLTSALEKNINSRVGEMAVNAATSDYNDLVKRANPSSSSSSSTKNTNALAASKKNGNDSAVAKSNDCDDHDVDENGERVDDLFMDLHNELKRQAEMWWFSEVEASYNYLRCLIHRYDWQGAADVAKQIVSKQGYQAALDAEVHKIFDEMGDPAGAMCFKFATRLIDGRILEENRDPGQRRRRPQIFGAHAAYSRQKQLGTHLAAAAGGGEGGPGAGGNKAPPLEMRDRDSEFAAQQYTS